MPVLASGSGGGRGINGVGEGWFVVLVAVPPCSCTSTSPIGVSHGILPRPPDANPSLPGFSAIQSWSVRLSWPPPAYATVYFLTTLPPGRGVSSLMAPFLAQ